MSAPGFWEILFLGVLALLIFGPQRLPQVARTVGKAIGQLKREASSTLDELKEAAEFEEYRGVADELRASTQELRRAADLSGPLASDERPRRRPKASAHAAPPVLFDPDAP